MESEIQSLATHLMKRPIAQIYENSNEKHNINALRLMCIVDYHSERIDLNSRICRSRSPKLLGQLLGFRKYENVKCFEYQAYAALNNKLLQCRFCELIGPYKFILTHMAMNHHELNITAKYCEFCNRKTVLKKHQEDGSLDACYAHYLNDRGIDNVDSNVFHIVADFYRMLIGLCQKLRICSVRNNAYLGRGCRMLHKLEKTYGTDISVDYLLVVPKRKFEYGTREIEELVTECNRIMVIFYGETSLTPVENMSTVIDVSDTIDPVPSDIRSQNLARLSMRVNVGDKIETIDPTPSGDGIGIHNLTGFPTQYPMVLNTTNDQLPNDGMSTTDLSRGISAEWFDVNYLMTPQRNVAKRKRRLDDSTPRVAKYPRNIPSFDTFQPTQIYHSNPNIETIHPESSFIPDTPTSSTNNIERILSYIRMKYYEDRFEHKRSKLENALRETIMNIEIDTL